MGLTSLTEPVLTVVPGNQVSDGAFVEIQRPEGIVRTVQELQVRQLCHVDLIHPIAPDVKSRQVPHPKDRVRRFSLDLVEANVEVLEQTHFGQVFR